MCIKYIEYRSFTALHESKKDFTTVSYNMKNFGS